MNELGHRGMGISVVGRFPPPIDGQALATARLSRLLSADFNVSTFDLEGAESSVRYGPMKPLSRFVHFAGLRRPLSNFISQHSGDAVLWPAVAPSILGHLRDRYTVLPAIRGRKCVAVVHRGDFDTLFRRLITLKSAVSLVKRIDQFVFLTQGLSRRCAPWIPDAKRSVIPNTIDDEVTFSDRELEIRRGHIRNRDRFRLLFVANMIPSKGYLDALEIARRLIGSGHNVDIHFAGQWISAADRADFEKRAESISGRVVHHGAVRSRSQMKALYNDANAYVLPTYYESEAQPLTIIEALNAGLPIVATKHAGIPEMIDDGVEGFLVTPNDVSLLTEAVKKLMEPTKWLQTSLRARERFMQSFSDAAVGEKWSDLLGQIALPGS